MQNDKCQWDAPSTVYLVLYFNSLLLSLSSWKVCLHLCLQQTFLAEQIIWKTFHYINNVFQNIVWNTLHSWPNSVIWQIVLLKWNQSLPLRTLTISLAHGHTSAVVCCLLAYAVLCATTCGASTSESFFLSLWPRNVKSIFDFYFGLAVLWRKRLVPYL